MQLDALVNHVSSLEGALILRPAPGDGSPEISWGDVFFYYAPDGQVPHGQPFATIVTKAYPDEDAPWLDDAGAFRLNIAVGREALDTLLDRGDKPEPGEPDAFHAHPVYGQLGWVAVTNPGERTGDHAVALLDQAHARARARWRTPR